MFLQLKEDPVVGAIIELPQDEVKKLRNVLRLEAGAPIAILPGDGRLIRCTFDGLQAEVIGFETLNTEPVRQVTLAQALPKGDKLEGIVRMGTEIGISRFLLFPSERSVVRWDAKKTQDRLRRLGTIAREAAEVCFRSRLPLLESRDSLRAILKELPDSIVLSEVEGVQPTLCEKLKGDQVTLVIGPEGGWSRSEVALIGDRAASLGPRVLRVDTAGCAAAAIALLQ